MKRRHLLASSCAIGISITNALAAPPTGLDRNELLGPEKSLLEFAPENFTRSILQIAGDTDIVSLDQQSDSVHDKIVERFPDGKPHVERYVTTDARGNFVNHGLYKKLAPNGDIVQSGTWEHGERDSQWQQTLNDRDLANLRLNLHGFKAPYTSTATFINGVLDGTWSVSDSRNKLVFSWEFTKGSRNGLSLWFASNGNKLRQVEYDMNQPTGSMFVWKEGDQTKPQQMEFVRGMELKKKTDYFTKTNRDKKEESSVLVASQLQVASHSWERSEVIYDTVQDAQPIRHGELKMWHKNGSLAHVGQYEFGEPVGEASWFYANGQRQTVGTYLAGAPSGQWLWWHENGMRQAEGGYEDGRQVGLWRSWSDRGQLVSSADKSDAPSIAELEFPDSSLRR